MNDFQATEEKTAKNCQRNGEMLNCEGAGKKYSFVKQKKKCYFLLFIFRSHTKCKHLDFERSKVDSPVAFSSSWRRRKEVVFTILSLKNNWILKYHIRSSLEKLHFRKVFLQQYITNVSQNNCLQKKEKFFLLRSRST